MSERIFIQPARGELTDGVPLLELRLGGVQRGFVILLVDEGTPEIETIEAMNTFALEGFESLAVAWAPGVEALALDRAVAAGYAFEQIGVVGIGGGAAGALDVARATPVGAVVSISPELDVDDVAGQPVLRSPWLALFGAEDDRFVRDDVARVSRLLDENADVFHRVVVYPGVGGDFHDRSETGLCFAASYDAWQRVVEWLLARVASRLTPRALAWRERTSA